jgi:lipopolysaccharide export system protein LptA
VTRCIDRMLLALVMAVCGLVLLLEEPALAQKTDQEPIHVTANKLEAEIKEKKVTFKEAVRAVQGDITITCRMMTVFYTEGQKSGVEGSQDVKEIVASGNVVITQKNRQIKGERAEYNHKERTIVITGNPVTANEGSNVVRGGRMIFYLDDERSIVEGVAAGQVEATIFPEKKPQPK